MTIVDLATRETIAEVPRHESLPDQLRQLAGDIENGSIKLESYYLIVEAAGDSVASDSGLTISEAIFCLEREKFRILCMAQGIKI